MHGIALFLVLLAVGTFLYFPRLAKALVGLGLTIVLGGGLYVAGWLLHEEYSAKPAREAAATERRAGELLKLYDDTQRAQAAAEADRFRKDALAEELAARYATPEECAASAARGKSDFERLYGTPAVQPASTPPLRICRYQLPNDGILLRECPAPLPAAPPRASRH